MKFASLFARFAFVTASGSLPCFRPADHTQPCFPESRALHTSHHFQINLSVNLCPCSVPSHKPHSPVCALQCGNTAKFVMPSAVAMRLTAQLFGLIRAFRCQYCTLLVEIFARWAKTRWDNREALRCARNSTPVIACLWFLSNAVCPSCHGAPNPPPSTVPQTAKPAMHHSPAL